MICWGPIANLILERFLGQSTGMVTGTLIVNSGLEWLLELSLQTVNWNGYWNSHCKQWTGMVTGTLIVNTSNHSSSLFAMRVPVTIPVHCLQ